MYGILTRHGEPSDKTAATKWLLKEAEPATKLLSQLNFSDTVKIFVLLRQLLLKQYF